MLERERAEHRREIRGLEEKISGLSNQLQAAEDAKAHARSEHELALQRVRSEAARERASTRDAAEAERVAAEQAQALRDWEPIAQARVDRWAVRERASVLPACGLVSYLSTRLYVRQRGRLAFPTARLGVHSTRPADRCCIGHGVIVV